MNTTKSSRYCLVAVLLLLSPITWASCSVATPNSYSTALEGSSSLTVARDATGGATLGGLYGPFEAYSTPATCTSPTAYFFLKFATPQTPTSYADVYETNISGIGVKVWSDALGTNGYASNNGTFWISSNDGTATYANNVAISSLRLQFYVTGAITTGQVTVPTIEGWINDSQSMAGAVKFGQITFNSSLNVSAKACTTPDVSVALGKHKIAEFSGIGTTSSSTSFNLQLNNCSANLDSVSYSFAPVTNLISGTAPYLTLDGSSTATGVGIQLLDNNDALVPFNTKSKFNGYSGTGGSYTLGLKARYIQTATTMKAGSANSSVVFTMSYQ